MLVKGAQFDVLPWTYPDYRQVPVRAFFDAQRAAYLQERRAARREEHTAECSRSSENVICTHPALFSRHEYNQTPACCTCTEIPATNERAFSFAASW